MPIDCATCHGPARPPGVRPRDIVDRQPRRGGDGSGGKPRERLHVAVQMGLVDVTALGRDTGGRETRREQMGRVVEPHQPGGSLGGDAELRPATRPQALAAPADLVRQAVDTHPATAGDRPPPDVGDLRIDPRPVPDSPPDDVRRHREPFVPRPCGTQPLLDAPGVAAPDVRQDFTLPLTTDDEPSTVAASGRSRICRHSPTRPDARSSPGARPITTLPCPRRPCPS